MAYFKTHYYGGIRKYQWVTIPLQLRGVVALKSGDAVPVVIGEGAEPKLVITGSAAPPRRGAEPQALGEAIPAETLNILLGSRPIGDADDKERVKLAVIIVSTRNTASRRTTSSPPSSRPSPRRTPRTSASTQA